MDNLKKHKSKMHSKIKLLFVILKFGLLLSLVIGIPLYITFFNKDLLTMFNSLDSVNQYLDQYKTASVFVYIGLQALQILISVIPGQPLNFAAGYAYTFGFGYLYSIIGAAIGTILAFYLAKFLGRDALHLMFGEKKIAKFIHKLNSKRGFIIVFVLYLIPGLPKDLLSYAAGVSEMRLKSFLIISLVGRSPGMMFSIMVGSMFNNESYIGIGVLSFVALILCIWGIKHHDKLTNIIDNWYDKLVKM